MRSSRHLAVAVWGLCSMLLVLGLGFPTMADAQSVRLSVSPKRLSYRDIPLGSHQIQSVTATNESNGDIAIAGIQAGPNPPFSVLTPNDPSECPAGSFTLPAGASCLVSVVFTPQDASSKVSGSLILMDNASNSPQSVNLVGNGVP